VSARIDRRTLLARSAGLALAAPLGVALASAERHGIALAAQVGGKTLVAAIPQATAQLDPAVAGSNGYGDIIPLTDNITEGITRFKSGTVEVEPCLAESWDVSKDGLTYTFKIRPNVKFHDGTALDAKAVETNYERQRDEKHPFHTEGMVYAPIVFADVDTIKATGDLELTITMTRPSILLPGNLAIFAAGIVSPTALEKLGKDFGQQPVGTGPFRI
jgi:peptide/nickel transport system substrate-binding protein